MKHGGKKGKEKKRQIKTRRENEGGKKKEIKRKREKCITEERMEEAKEREINKKDRN